ncbi:MAG: hypothetical protein V1734_04325, partial [Nanoarchaeota archaeon]
SQIGYTYTLVDADKNAESVVNAIKSGKIKLVTRQLPIYKFAIIILYSIYKSIAAKFISTARKLFKR